MPRLPPKVFAMTKRLFATAVSRARLATRTDSPWRKLPGHRLELADTGYDIRMELHKLDGKYRFVYAAYDPEGNTLAMTPGLLDELKAFVEVQARARQEMQL